MNKFKSCTPAIHPEILPLLPGLRRQNDIEDQQGPIVYDQGRIKNNKVKIDNI
jgi:hypothetical protein